MDPVTTDTLLIDTIPLESMAGLGPEDYLDLLGDVVISVPEYLEKIRADILSGNHEALDQHCHSLRGMISYFGCVALGGRLHEFRQAPPPRDQADAVHGDLLDLWQRSLTALKDWEKSVPGFQPLF